MTHKIPAYRPLVNKHLRFYFSNPEQTFFRSAVDEKQFKAVEKIVRRLTYSEIQLLRAIMLENRPRNEGDNYIARNCNELATSNNDDVSQYFKLLFDVSRNIAVELEYIPGEKEG